MDAVEKKKIILELLYSLNKGNSNSWVDRVDIAIEQFNRLEKEGVL